MRPVREWERVCPTCNGRGIVGKDSLCPKCKGERYIPKVVWGRG